MLFINNMSQFDISKSSVKADTFQDFFDGFKTESELLSIPGLGNSSLQKLSDNGINSHQQLIGKFLMFCHKDSTTAEVCQNFYTFIKPFTSGCHAHSITFAIANIVDKYGIYKYNIQS